GGLPRRVQAAHLRGTDRQGAVGVPGDLHDHPGRAGDRGRRRRRPRRDRRLLRFRQQLLRIAWFRDERASRPARSSAALGPGAGDGDGGGTGGQAGSGAQGGSSGAGGGSGGSAGGGGGGARSSCKGGATFGGTTSSPWKNPVVQCKWSPPGRGVTMTPLVVD